MSLRSRSLLLAPTLFLMASLAGAQVADFSGTPTSGVAPLGVTFTDASTGTITAWSWTFGDGGTSTVQNPSHTYTAAGVYTVALTATGPGGSDTNTKTDYVTVSDPPPVAGFSGTPTTGVAPLGVTFTDATTGPVTTWAWTFGDGGTATAQNPSHTYTAAGVYTVALTATGPGGSDTDTKTNYVTVGDPPPVAGFSGTPTTGAAPLGVTFTDATTGPVTAWAWTFGDGGTSTAQNPSHTYTAAGVYTVALTATGPGGSDTDTKTNYITVGDPPPTADFTGTPVSGVAPLGVTFTDASGGTVTSWSWTFGDGGTSTLQNPSYTYTAAGTYSVALSVTGPSGSDTNTKTNYITVNAAPVANFVGSPTTGNEPLLVNFSDLSTGSVTSWSWTFGDGGTSTAQNPSRTYVAAGVYTVALTVSGPAGSDSNTKVDYITVNVAPPVAEFSGSPTSGIAPLLVSFTDASTGPITSWAWDFGDSTSSTLQNPNHTFTGTGTFTVALTVTGPNGSDTNTKTNYITLNEPAPVANFSGVPLAGDAPLGVNFLDLSTGNVTAWSWTFGDGGGSTVQNPNYTYLVPGTYSVELTVTSAGGSDTETKVDYVTVNEPPLVANFTGSPTTGVAPLTVNFTDTSTGTITSWAWDFGDGATSTAEDPSHVYSASGLYSVSLTVNGTLGTDSLTKTDYITVNDPPPVADFSGSPTTGIAPFVVNFSDLSVGTVTAWSWDFGDGFFSTHQNPSHTYSTPGTYTVALLVTGPSGSNSSTKFNYITVNWPAPVSAFAGTPTTGFAPLQVSFTDASVGNITDWAWNFGDGGGSTLEDPIYTYTTPGIYTVSLTTTGPGGSDVETKPSYVTVTEPPPVAEFSGLPIVGEAPLASEFTDASTGTITNWSWNFGDGGSSALQNPVHVYGLPGVYTVSLTVSGPGGSDTETKRDYVLIDAGLSDPSFEAQTPGLPPADAWTVDFGLGHIVNPDGIASDGLLPTDGTNWCELSAEGTNAGTPPSNPGGAGTPPSGGAGISQVFLYPSGLPVLLCDAVFLRNEESMQPTHNDWMSIDVTDGVTSVNFYYRDTFTPANSISEKYGWASTGREVAAIDLEAAFPSATSATVFTLTVQVANGGDAIQASRGYVDNFRFLAPPASQEYGCGINPTGSMLLLSGTPRMNTTITFGVDNPVGSQSPGAIPLVAVSTSAWPTFPCGVPLPGFGMSAPTGELLVRTGPFVVKPLLIGGALWAGPGMPAQVDLVIPNVPSLIGYSLYAQGILLDLSPNASPKFGFANAFKLDFGP